MAAVDFWGYDDTVGEPLLTLSNAVIASGAARTGAGGLNVNGSGGTATHTLSASTASPILGFAFQTATFAAASIFRFCEGATVHCAVGADASGHLTIYGPAGTVLATSTVVLSINVWYYIEVVVVIADSGGSVTVYVDGTSAVTFSGDTKNGSTGVCDNVKMIRPTSGFFVDDTYILSAAGSAPFNARLGDIAVRTLLPSGNGASSQWTNSAGNSTNNYSYVDEANSSSTDYVGAAAASLTDTYAMGDIPTTDTPLATQILVYAAKSDAGTPPVMKPVTRGDGGTVLEESAITLSTTYQVFAGAVRTTDPDGDALTATNVNGMQAGVRSA